MEGRWKKNKRNEIEAETAARARKHALVWTLLPQTGMCSFFQTSGYQEFMFTDGLITVPTAAAAELAPQCLARAPLEQPALLHRHRSHQNYQAQSLPLLAGNAGSWRFVGHWCLARPRDDTRELAELFLSPCTELQAEDRATLEELEEQGENRENRENRMEELEEGLSGFPRLLRIAGDGRCLAAQGSRLVASHCKDTQNQLFWVQNGQPLCKGTPSMKQCLQGSENVPGDMALEPCANIAQILEQRQLFLREPSPHSPGFFSLRQGRWCLGAVSRTGSRWEGSERQLALVSCDTRKTQKATPKSAAAAASEIRGLWSLADGALVWSEIHGPSRSSRSSRSRWCLTAERLVPLAEPSASSASSAQYRPWGGFHAQLRRCLFEDYSQRFEVFNGSVFVPGHVADQGRSRFPALCLATSESSAKWRALRADPCNRRHSLLWRKLYQEVPMETRLMGKKVSRCSCPSGHNPLQCPCLR